MKEIKLTQGLVAMVDDEDYEKLNQFKWQAKTNCSVYYAKRRAPGPKRISETIWMHRDVLGTPPAGMEIDHIDGNGLNNQKKNLRFCTHKENMQNQHGIRPTNTSGVPGVSRHKQTGKWRAQIQKDNKFYHLGLFDNKEDAIEAIKLFKAKQ